MPAAYTRTVSANGATMGYGACGRAATRERPRRSLRGLDLHGLGRLPADGAVGVRAFAARLVVRRAATGIVGGPTTRPGGARLLSDRLHRLAVARERQGRRGLAAGADRRRRLCV